MAPPNLPLDVLIEIFVRLPSPTSLLRCALVCKEWRELILSPGTFRGRFVCSLLLGLFDGPFRFIPTTFSPAVRNPAFLFPPFTFHRQLSIFDCRNGRVVFLDGGIRDDHLNFIVYNPLIQEWSSLPPLLNKVGESHFFRALIVLTDVDRDLPPSPAFRLAVIVFGPAGVGVRTFDSGAGDWNPIVQSDIAGVELVGFVGSPVVIRGMAVFWPLTADSIISMDMETSLLSLIKLRGFMTYRIAFDETADSIIIYVPNILLATTEDGELCFIQLNRLRLSIWFLQCEDGTGGNANDNANWVLQEVDLLNQMRPEVAPTTEEELNGSTLEGFGERSGVVLVDTRHAIFAYHLRSKRLEELYTKVPNDYDLVNFRPYEMEWPPLL